MMHRATFEFGFWLPCSCKTAKSVAFDKISVVFSRVFKENIVLIYAYHTMDAYAFGMTQIILRFYSMFVTQETESRAKVMCI